MANKRSTKTRARVRAPVKPPRSKAGSLVSVGYQQRTPDEFVSILHENDVNLLLDVRELPLSRRKGFSKSALGERLDAAGIEYIHVREAGNPYRKLASDIRRCLAMYRSYIKAKPSVVEMVLAHVAGRNAAVMCFERLHRECHRSVLLDAMRDAGVLVPVVYVE